MPPKKLDTVAEGVADTAGSGMRADDVLFLIDCLQNSAGGQVQIDCSAVAKKRNMTNPKSVANRIAVMKKKYGIPLATSTSKAVAKISDVVDGNNDVTIGTQASPVKRTPKKTAARKAPYKVVKRDESPAQSPSDNNVEEDRQSAMDTDEMENMVFGHPDKEENDGHQDGVVNGNHDIV